MRASTAPIPLGAGDRIQSMDVLRGFALLGILLMNIEGMVGPLDASMTGVDPTLTGADRVADTLIYLLVQGKFFPLFSLLFGMGFAVMLTRAETADRPFVGIYLRRVLVLLVIGLAHGLLVWSGDILLSYALLALPLLFLFRGTALAHLLKWAVVLMLIPCTILLASGVASLAMDAIPESAGRMQEALTEIRDEIQASIEAQRIAYGSGSYGDAVAQRAADVASALGGMVEIGAFLLGLFVLGAWFVRSGAITDPASHARMFAGLRWIALPMGLAITMVSWWIAPTLDFTGTSFGPISFALALQMPGGALMALGYLAWIVRALQGSPLSGILQWLAPAGRMALTNYLLQSLVMTWLFYGYGLGYFEQLPRAWQPLLVFVFFALQVVASRWWLSRHRFGPAEWIWRWATYGTRPRLRIS